MFNAPELSTLISTNKTIRSSSMIIAEWNMNDPENFAQIGNYRHRWTTSGDPKQNLISQWDNRDAGDWWTGATSADVVVQGPFDDNNDPTYLTEETKRWKLLYSLDDCLKPHRPRSGINYMLFNGASGVSYLPDTPASSQRPRVYPSSPKSSFKYWTSYRKEQGGIYGISKLYNGTFAIEDSCPFVVYKQSVPTNKIVVKMQTHIGTEDRSTSTYDDPMYGNANATTPKRWSIQVLKGNDWVTAKSFQQNETRSDGTPVVPADGYVELTYGLLIPSDYEGPHRFVGSVTAASLLPEQAYPGDYFYVVANEGEKGTVYLWNDGDWVVLVDPKFGWQLNEDYDNTGQHLLSDMTNLPTFTQQGKTVYKEFEYIRGIRIVVYTMNKKNSTFDLIEMSPRLVSDITDKTVSYSVQKSTGKIDETALPVGGLEAGTGSIEIFDHDEAFNENNNGSIISNYLNTNITFSFWDVIENANKNYYVPIKKMHSEGKMPQYSELNTVKYDLRDSFYILENEPAPAIFIRNVSLSYAICLLLDAVGFSNYVIRRDASVPEPRIPFFFIGPDQNVAEVLQKLAIATQSAMFFDEYNNLVVMYKDYMFDTDNERGTDLVLDGNSSIPNIADISSTEKKVFNAGTINYTERYIQRAISSLGQDSFVNQDRTYQYLPALLWEVAGDDSPRTVNEKVSQQSNYALSAMPLAVDLNNQHPTVVNGSVQNNVIDVGENIYWLPRYSGYLYANGEIIKFDAVQYNVAGQTVWISSNDEYQEYFSKLPFNAKIYPTGRIRIYTEPYYYYDGDETRLKPGAVARSGRAQFQTDIAYHRAGIANEWTSDSNIKGIDMPSRYLFEGVTPPATTLGAAGLTGNVKALASSRTSIIKNYLRNPTYTEAAVDADPTSRNGNIQSSALVFSGPKTLTGTEARNLVSYVCKEMNDSYKHFGTRLRIVGKIESSADIEDQTPTGSSGYYPGSYNGESFTVSGGSGGLGIGVNKATNNGYFFEVIALSTTSLDNITTSANVELHNLIFYKVVSDGSGVAIPIKLWGGLADIIVDTGTWAGESRSSGDDQTTVYDVAVEYEKVGNSLRFHLFVNDQEVATVTDTVPIPIGSSMCLFVRGKSKLMFENVYAMKRLAAYSLDGNLIVDQSKVGKAFDAENTNISSFRKYGISGMVQQGLLDNITPQSETQSKLYYDEFGTIMRECSYFDVKYDKAYPALTSQISPMLTSRPGIRVVGYEGGAYGARFLVFNVMDKTINLDDTSGNYLRIQGVAFTQDTTHELTMDNYFNETSNLADPEVNNGVVLTSPVKQTEFYRNIKVSRMKYGRSEWTLESDYIQTQAAANNLMGWLADKTSRPRQLVGVEIFNNPLVQLGDIVSINYSVAGVDKIAPPTKRFVVYNIEQERSSDGPFTKIYLSEV